MDRCDVSVRMEVAATGSTRVLAERRGNTLDGKEGKREQNNDRSRVSSWCIEMVSLLKL